MLLHPGPGRLGVRSLQGPPKPSRASKGLQAALGTSGASGGASKSPKNTSWARLKFHAGWSGWTRPPTMGGGGGSAQAEGSRGGFERI